MLDRRDLAPVGYKRYNKASGKEVAWNEVVKGYEYREGSYVVLSDEDFRRANVEASKTVEIHGFVETGAIPPQYFDTPYYLSPGKRGEKAYALLRDALVKAGKAGVATVVIRTRQYLAAVVPLGEVLLLNTLRYAEEVRSTEDVGIPEKLANVKVSAKELELALRLVDDMSEKWQPQKYKDTYREDLLARIEEKVKAGQTEEITPPEKGEGRERKGADVIDLMSLLKKSVEKKKPAKRAASPRRKRAA
jgi:DNA end-binding protein Ku